MMVKLLRLVYICLAKMFVVEAIFYVFFYFTILYVLGVVRERERAQARAQAQAQAQDHAQAQAQAQDQAQLRRFFKVVHGVVGVLFPYKPFV